MQLDIKKSVRLNELKSTFSNQFPFLKIELFGKRHSNQEPSSMKEMIDENKPLGELVPNIKEGALLVKPADTVASIEQAFEKQFGLHVQVFRKQNNVWIETTRTDALSLERQNEMGRQASADQPDEKVADIDLRDGEY